MINQEIKRKRVLEGREDGRSIHNPYALTNNSMQNQFAHPGQGRSRSWPRYHYLLAYAIPALVVLVTMAVDQDHYRTEDFCFLNNQNLGALLGSFVVPALILVTVILGFILSSCFVLKSAPSRVTQQLVENNLNANEEENSLQSLIYGLSGQLFLGVFCVVIAGYQLTLYSKIPNVWMSVAVALILVVYAVFVFAFFCLTRSDVVGSQCCSNTKAKGAMMETSPTHEQEMMTSNNLVELCPRPVTELQQQQPYSGFTVYDADHPSMEVMPPPQSGLVKQVNMINPGVGVGYGAPANSEVDYSLAPSLFGPRSAKISNHNIHVDPGMRDKQPKTSSPAGSHIPAGVQDITISPLMAGQAQQPPYSVVPVQFKVPSAAGADVSLPSVNTGLDYTEGSIKAGAPCGMATFDFTLTPQGSRRVLMQDVRREEMPRTSLPRSLRRPRAGGDDDAHSKFSAAQSIGNSSRHSSHHGKKKKPNRRRPRDSMEKSEQPLYSSKANNADDDYLGDYDTLERARNNADTPPSDAIPENDHELDEMDPLMAKEDGDQDCEEPASLDDLPPPGQFDASELSKRETSV